MFAIDIELDVGGWEHVLLVVQQDRLVHLSHDGYSVFSEQCLY